MLIQVHPKEPADKSKLVNTRVSYLYRDAANWKQHNECVVRGCITEDQKRVIMDSLIDGTDFVPAKVGLPETRFETRNDDDVDTFELYEDGLEPTASKPDVDIAIADLTAAFAAMKDRWLEPEAR